MKANLSATDAMRSLTVKVRIRRVAEMRARIWIGTQLIRLAIAILGCRGEIETLPPTE